MFDQVLDSLRKATEINIQAQQELFKKWGGFLPTSMPNAPTAWGDQAQKMQKKWIEFVSEVVKKQQEALETQFKNGMRSLEEGFKLAEIRDAEELRGKTLDLWKKTFEQMRQTYETQAKGLQSLATQWTELMTRGAA